MSSNFQIRYAIGCAAITRKNKFRSASLAPRTNPFKATKMSNFETIYEDAVYEPTPTPEIKTKTTQPTPHPTMLPVIKPYEANTYFTHGARELQYDSYSESHYFSVPYRGGHVIRQDFGNKKGKGKGRERNANPDPDSLVVLNDAMRETQRTYKELPYHLKVTGESMWRSLSQRHHVTLDKELMDPEIKFFPEGPEVMLRDMWSTLRGRFDLAMGKAQQRWDGGSGFL
ncbi:hypothetical protein DXG01_014001 [Tephrocybe rancida]|nr:hypothetical protein DXG01_014001 [Tephrocybe rancida]